MKKSQKHLTGVVDVNGVPIRNGATVFHLELGVCHVSHDKYWKITNDEGWFTGVAGDTPRKSGPRKKRSVWQATDMEVIPDAKEPANE